MLHKKKTICILGSYSLTSLRTVCTSCVRCVYIAEILNTSDPPWDGAMADVWSFVELNLFIVCGSTPTLRKFFKHFCPRLMVSASSRFSSNNSSRHNESNHTHAKPSTIDDIMLGDVVEVPSNDDQDPHRNTTTYEVMNLWGEGSSKDRHSVNVREKDGLGRKPQAKYLDITNT